MTHQHGHCAYCDGPFCPAEYGTRATKDHVVPRSFKVEGGAETIRGNVVLACGRCNSLKRDLLPSQIFALANEHEARAARLRMIAERAEIIIKERKLL